MIYKVCFWLNMPTHHQTGFLNALSKHPNIDIQVRFFDRVSEERINTGWEPIANLPKNQKFVNDVDQGLESLKDWKERIHIISGYSSKFNIELLDLIIKNKVKWCHWSERIGVGLAKKVNYSIFLFRLLKPFFLLTKRGYGKKVNNYALGAFAIGELAREDLISIGIDEDKIDYLFYALEPLKRVNSNVFQKNKEDLVFLYLGSLYKGKGIDLLIKAFNKLNHQRSKLILAGPDQSNAKYFNLVKKLKLEDKVLFTGAVPSSDINKYLSYADVFVLPSRYDGWGAVLNEAISIGLPIISTDQTGAAYHLIKNNVNGFMIKAGDLQALYKAMNAYINNSKLAQLQRRESIEMSQNFIPKSNVKRFINSIEKWIRTKTN